MEHFYTRQLGMGFALTGDAIYVIHNITYIQVMKSPSD
jgi:hypothetical protein